MVRLAFYIIIFLLPLNLAFGERVVLAEINNYDNNENLEKAMAYDLTLPSIFFNKNQKTGEPAKYSLLDADRVLADKYYHKYLQEEDNSFQKARVYWKLSRLWWGAVSPRVTKKYEPIVNKEKAFLYAKKAIELEPNRIGIATVYARAMLISDSSNYQERLEKYLNHYDWLLSINKNTLTKKYLPNYPGDKPEEKKVEAFLIIVKDCVKSAEIHLIENAVQAGFENTIPGSTPPLDYTFLIKIIEKYPETQLAKKAKRKMNYIVDSLVNKEVSTMVFEDVCEVETSHHGDISIPSIHLTNKNNSQHAFDVLNSKLVETKIGSIGEKDYFIIWDGEVSSIKINADSVSYKGKSLKKEVDDSFGHTINLKKNETPTIKVKIKNKLYIFYVTSFTKEKIKLHYHANDF